MASIRFLPMPRFRAFDDNGNPLGGGKVYVYAAGTSTKITTWQDANKEGANTNPVILDSEGYADIFFDQSAKIVLDDSNDVQQWSLDNVSPLNAQDVTGKFNLVENGSFELDGDGDGNPDSWTISLFDSGTSTVEIDSGEAIDGVQALKFVSQGDGGGTATSNTFGVPAGENVNLSFFIKSTVADVRNIVEIEYLDKDDNAVSTTTAYDESSSNPTSFTRQITAEAVPASATQARVKLTGCDSSDSTSGTTWFDAVQFTTQSYIFTGAAGEVTADASELNTLDGITQSTEYLNTGILTAEVRMYAGSSEPSGWLFCSGQAVSRTTYAALFNAIGTTFGNGDGSTTFNVPDLRDRSPLGENTMGASDAGRVGTTSTGLGDTGGEDEHTLTEAELPSHNHGGSTGNGGSHSHGFTYSGDLVTWDSGSNVNNRTIGSGITAQGDGGSEAMSTDGVGNHSHSISTAGSDNAHNNMHPFLALNFIIKT